MNMLLLTPEEKAQFDSIAPEAEYIYCTGREIAPDQLARATVILGWPRPEDLQQAKNLKWVQTMWAGTEEYTVPGVLAPGVKLTASSGVNCRGVAEYLLAAMMTLCRRMPNYRDYQRQHRWVHGDCYGGPAKTILGADVLVVGAGRIGSAFAGMCQGLGAHTIGVKRTVRGPVEGFDEVYPNSELDRLLPLADIVALCMPHTAETVGLMSARRIASMKDDAILLNAGRGSVLDQAALIQNMAAGRLWGAALDVTQQSPCRRITRCGMSRIFC